MNLNEINPTKIAVLLDLPIDHRNRLIKVALASIQPLQQDRSKIIKKLSTELDLSLEQLYDILGLLIKIIQLFLKTNDKEFNIKLIDLGFPLDFIDNLPLISNRKEIVDICLKNSFYEFILFYKWRIDLSCSQSSVTNKVPSTMIFLCIHLSNGKQITINMNNKTFHKLRFNIALILKELNLLKNHNIFSNT